MSLVPGGEISLRLLAGGLAVGAVWSLGALARRVGVPPGPAMALLASNALVLLMCSYGRMYTLLLWVVTASAALAFKAADDNSRSARVLFGLLICAGLLTHNWFVFFLPGLLVWIWAERGRAVARLLVPCACAILAWAAIWGYPAYLQLTSRAQQLAWLRPPTAGNLADTLLAHLWLLLLAAPVWLVAAGLRKPSSAPRGALALLRGLPVSWPATAAAAIGVGLPWLVSQWKPVYNPRFTIIVAPFLACALAPFVKRGGAAVVTALLSLGAAWPLWDAAHQPLCTSRAAAQVLERLARPGDTVVFCRLTRKPVEFYWHPAAIARFSFPASIDDHPGYEGTLPPDQLARQAHALLGRASGRVFILVDDAAPASRVLLSELKGRPASELLSEPASGKHYFNRLLLVSPSESPSAAPRE
jgi:hypothetical protein